MSTYNQDDLVEYGSNIFSIDVTNPEDLAKYVIPLIQGLNTVAEKAGNINLKDLLEGFGFAQYLARAQARNEYGVGFHWYLGTQANMPERSFILNGQNLLIPSSIDDDYWYAYKEWGTKYNTEETPSGYFGTPDFMTRADGTNGPNYLGSTGDFAQVGTKLIDTIRNIYGKFSIREMDSAASIVIVEELNKLYTILRDTSNDTPTSAFALDLHTTDAYRKSVVTFDASKVTNTGDVNKPYTILCVPIYIY